MHTLQPMTGTYKGQHEDYRSYPGNSGLAAGLMTYRPQRIIVDYDLGQSGEGALRTAELLAGQSGSLLQLVHVLDPSLWRPSVFTPVFQFPEFMQRAEAQLRAVAKSVRLAHCSIEHEVRTGERAAELLRVCQDWQAGLLIVSKPIPHLFRHAPVPVLTVKTSLTHDVKTFLVPTDFSPNANLAAKAALDLAQRMGAHVIFLHALDLYPYLASNPMMGFMTSPIDKIPTPESIEGEWHEFLTALPGLQHVSWERRTVYGSTSSAILQQAADCEAGLIVMGTHARSGLSRFVLGSVTDRVVNKASCSVLTVTPAARPWKWSSSEAEEVPLRLAA